MNIFQIVGLIFSLSGFCISAYVLLSLHNEDKAFKIFGLRHDVEDLKHKISNLEKKFESLEDDGR